MVDLGLVKEEKRVEKEMEFDDLVSYPLLLEVLELLVEEELSSVGYLVDSDNCERFLEAKTLEITESSEKTEMVEDLIRGAKNWIRRHSKRIGYIKPSGDYVGYYYKKDLNFETVEELERFFRIGE